MVATKDWQAIPMLEKVLDVVPGIIYVFNQKTQSNEYSNRSLGDLLGYSSAELQALGDAMFPTLAHPEDLPRIVSYLSLLQSAQDQEILRLEYRMRHKKGHWVWLLSHDTVFAREDDGSVLQHVGVATDITAQKLAEHRALDGQHEAEELGAEQKRVSELLTQIMDTAKSAIIGLKGDGEILAINSAGRHFLGGVTTPTPFHWPERIEFVDRESLQQVEDSLNPVRRSLAGQAINGEIFSMTKRGADEIRYIRVSSAPDNTAEPAFKCVLILDDVSEQEKHRQQVERTSRLDALGQLTGGIAHDFNNLLATVQYALELAQTENAANRQSYLETAKLSVDRGSELTKRLLAFAKQQPGLSASKDVDGIVDEFRRLATPLIEASVDVKYAIKEEDLWVYCDTAQLGNALLNLLLNARDAILRSGTGSKITVLVRGINELDADLTLRREHPNTYIAKGLYAEHSKDHKRADNTAFRYVEFAVTDNGPGMPEEVKRRAIDPFFTTKSTNSGTGLGLSMVYGFIQQANGELRIYSEPGQGTTVRLLLPRGTPFGEREEPLLRDKPAQGNGESILIVEDEISLAMLLDDLITSLGYVVETVSSGVAAMELLDSGDHFDLLITDIVIPGGMDGFKLAQSVRDKSPDMPLIYMSGYTGYTDTDMGAVVAPMLQKPCPPLELAQAIHTALNPS